MKYFVYLTIYVGLVQSVVDAVAKIQPRSVKSIPRPIGRSDWHHEQFGKLYSESIQPGAQTIFGYWCGPTLGGYCGSMSFDDINPNAVTHVPFAFAEITSDGTVSYTYDQGSVQQYNSSILIEQGIMAGLSLGGSATDADNCLNNINNCVTTLCATLLLYEQMGSPFYFVDSDFEKPYQEQMTNLIAFWTQFDEQCPGYLLTMAPECAYLQLDCLPAYPGCTYCNTYVSVVNELGPYGTNQIYKINIQDYNNAGCSINYQMGEVGFYNDTARTWMSPCENSEYLGLMQSPDILGIGFLGANADGAGYAQPATVTQALQVVDEVWRTSNAMFWDTLTDYKNIDGQWVTSNAMRAANPGENSLSPSESPTFSPSSILLSETPTIMPTSQAPSESPSVKPSFFPTVKPTAPTVEPSSSAPTIEPTSTEPSSQPSSAPSSIIAENDEVGFFDTTMGKAIEVVGGVVLGFAGIYATMYAINTCHQASDRGYELLSN